MRDSSCSKKLGPGDDNDQRDINLFDVLGLPSVRVTSLPVNAQDGSVVDKRGQNSTEHNPASGHGCGDGPDTGNVVRNGHDATLDISTSCSTVVSVWKGTRMSHARTLK